MRCAPRAPATPCAGCSDGVIELPDLDEPVAGPGEAAAEPDPPIAGDNVRRFPA